MNNEQNLEKTETKRAERVHHSRIKLVELKSSKALQKKSGGTKSGGCVPCFGSAKPGN